MEKFKLLKLDTNLLKAIEEAGFKEPSEIQEKTIPLVLEGRDVVGSSATGSGKTLAFGAGIIEKIKKGQGIQALVLTPTRELAEQVTKNLRNFSKYYHLKVQDIYGGVAIEPQISALRSADIVVGTPGRIMDHLDRKTLNLSGVKFLVLDEADRMLDMGFIDDVRKIVNKCPKERQTLLFSATISVEIDNIASHYMKNPINIEVDSYVDPSKLKQIYYDVPDNLKFSLLVSLLQKEKKGLVMVFCNTRRNTDLVAQNLKRYNIHSLAIHGGLPQNKRNSIMKLFHSQEVLTLVCTDVAARGLDIKNVSHVYNYDIPKTSTEYVHRIGRTARAGKEGIAICLVSSRDYENFSKVIENPSLKIDNVKMPYVNLLPVSFNSRNTQRERPGRINYGNHSRRDYSRNNQREDDSRGNRNYKHKRDSRDNKPFKKRRY